MKDFSYFSDRFVANIDVPFLVLQANDDPICTNSNMPMADLLRNPNCFVIKTRNGGHCDFFSKMDGHKKYQRVSNSFMDNIIVLYAPGHEIFRRSQQFRRCGGVIS